VKSFSEFKKELELSSEQLEKLTGYTRQGLHYAFSMIDKGKKPSRQFLKCMDIALNKKIEEETLQFTQRIEKLKQMQNELNGLKESENRELQI
jgi:hypothetical protein